MPLYEIEIEITTSASARTRKRVGDYGPDGSILVIDDERRFTG